MRAVAVLLLFGAAGCAQSPPADRILASGHVEATEVRLAPEVGGRIVLMSVSEGDRVEPGTLILRIASRDIDLAIDRARADEQQAAAQLALLQAGARREDIAHAEAQAQAARGELAALRADLEAAETDLQRFEDLLQARAGSGKQRDDAASRRDVARQRVEAAESRVRAADLAAASLRAGARAPELDAARARVAGAAAQIASLEATRSDTTLVSPVAGIVTKKLAELGEIVAPRTPVVVITDLAQAWADVFVPQPAVARIRIGQAATIVVDREDSSMTGTVSYISPRAEFTPRNVQTADERSKLVYRIRVSVDNRDGVLKQGMPVDAIIPLQVQP
jgi:HlyD family secretion protein